MMDATYESQSTAPVEQNDPYATVTPILHEIGVTAHLKGYVYLRDAILMAFYEGSLIKGICKDLYPLVAWKNSTTPHRVERNMRYVIGLAWESYNGQAARVFGDTFGIGNGRPTNSQFIAMVTSKLRIAAESG